MAVCESVARRIHIELPGNYTLLVELLFVAAAAAAAILRIPISISVYYVYYVCVCSWVEATAEA